MDKLEDDYFFIFFKDLKKSCQNKLKAYLSENGIDELKEITENKLPVIVVGTSDDEDVHNIDLDSMVS